MSYDLIIKDGTVVTTGSVGIADVAIRYGKIAAIGEDLQGAAQTIDATGKVVVPGGIETHCHIEQEAATGAMTSDDYFTGSRSAAFGGNTTFVPFAAQHRGQKIPDVLATYDERAQKSVIDYSYHLIVSDPTEDALKTDLPAAFARGVTSFKVFMTYDKLIISDAQFLDVLAMARENGGLVMVHAENHAMIKAATARLVAAGQTQPKYHAESHPPEAEVEAVQRAIALARSVNAPLFFVHISTEDGARAVAHARMDGAMIYGETCPQYLFLTADDLDRPDGAKFICSPPLRDTATQDVLWRHLTTGTLQLYSSDHAPYRHDATGKLAAGPNPPFHKTANGLPGIELRLPLLFSEGVKKGRITVQDFVALSAGNAARMFGMDQRKGAIAPGYDADIAIWDPGKTRTVTAGDLHDNMDYTPFEGWQITGWPETLINRGRVVVDKGALKATPGDGTFIPRRPFDPTGL